MKLSRLAALVCALFAGASCSDTSGVGTGRISLVLKDAPGDITEAVVTISEINLQGSGASIVLTDTKITTNLLTLAADFLPLVEGIEIPAGAYTQLRFVITGGYIKVDNGDGTFGVFASSPTYEGLPLDAVVTGSLQMPSYGQSGLKVILPGGSIEVTDGGHELLVLDFDVSESFGHVAGKSGQWVMHPVIKGTYASTTGHAKVTLALGEGVTLPGTVSLGTATTTITGSDGIPRLAAFTDGDGDGVFEADFSYIPAGDYTVSLSDPVGITNVVYDPDPAGVTLTVPLGGTGTAAFLVLSFEEEQST
jgi:hypothetical protein